MKKVLNFTLTLCMVLMLFAVMPAQVSAATSGTCGDNLTWTLDDAGTLTISGTGAMTKWEWVLDVPWYDYRNSIISVKIEDSVTSIGSYAFYDCRSLTSIEIPDSVTSIGDDAFSYCYSLTNIEIPDSVTSIGAYAFSYCDGLRSVKIGNGVTSIGRRAFYYCSSLKTVYYTGTEEQWNKISIGNENSPILNAEIIFNCGVKVSGVELDRETLSMSVDDTATLTVTVSPEDATNKNVTWESSDTAVATVENGVVNAISKGSAIITVTTEDGGYTATCTVTVKQDTTSPIADIATLRCHNASFSEDKKTISIDVDRFPVVNVSGSLGVAIIPVDGYTVSYNFTSSNGTTSGFSNTNTSKYTLLSTGVNTEISGGGALGNVPMKIFKKENSTRIYVDVVLTNGTDTVTYKMTIALRDPAVGGNVNIEEIKPLRADANSFVLDNYAKKIYYETLPGVTSAGFAVRVDNDFTKATRPRRVLTAKSGMNLAHGDIKTEEKDTFDRYVVARRSAGATQTYQVKVHGGEDGLKFTWYTVTVVFK